MNAAADAADDPGVQPSIEMLLYLAEFGVAPEAVDDSLELDPIEIDEAMQITPQSQPYGENIEAAGKPVSNQPKIKDDEL